MATARQSERRKGLFATKDTDELVRDTEEKGASLQRVVGLLDLTALGLGAIIGTGIFVVIGEAIGDAGPAIILSFLLAGVTCAFSALAFAELASTIPVAGSAYTYSYATLGEIVAWIIGWDLILEYAVSVAGVAVGWGQYFNDLADSLFGFDGRSTVSQRVDDRQPHAVRARGTRRHRHGGVGDLLRLHRVRRHLDVGRGDEEPGERPAGRDHRVAGDRDGALHRVAVVAVGALRFDQLKGAEAPLAKALDEGAGFGWAANIISFGALIAITSVVLTILYGQTRIMFAMCRDGLMPRAFANVNQKTRTPIRITATFGFLIGIIAAFVPLTEIVKLVNIGTLFAFIVVNIGVIVLRRTKPDLERGYRVPLVPVFPIVGTLLCLYLMRYLERDTWFRFIGWLLAGLIIYFIYGRRHSRLQRGEVVNPEAELEGGR